MDDDKLTIPPLHLGSDPWAIRPEMLPRLIEANRLPNLAAWESAMGRHLDAGANAGPRALRRGASRMSGSVAVIPLSGVLTPRGSFLSLLFGGGSGGLRAFREDFAEAVDSPEIGAIVIDVNSPGGLVEMVLETGRVIREARGEKPIIAVANTLAASGAYWLAAQADELVVTPSGRVGSIGVYMVHEDWSKFNEEFGVSPTYVSAGRYKTEGNPDEPLSDEAKADWQTEVETLYQRFLSEVATGRDIAVADVASKYGEGRCLLSDAALAAQMVDRVDTIESVVAELLGGGSAGKSAKGVRLAQAGSPGARAGDDDNAEDDDEEQPHCSGCGRWISTGESECEECKATDDDDEDDDERSDHDEDDEEEVEPKATEQEAREAAAALLFG